jgi:hypothetical protein
MKRTTQLVPAAMTACCLLMAGMKGALAQPVLDGFADGLYGTALSIQNTNTQFGDNSSPDLIATANGGSEINQVFGIISGNTLYVTITGNLETNFNKLEVFFDTNGSTTGVNSIVGSALPGNVDGFCCGNTEADGALQRQDGLTFDAGFFADYYVTITHGRENITPEGGSEIGFYAASAHYADLTNGASGTKASLGMQLGPQGLPNVLRGPLGPDFNSNFQVGGEDLLTWQRNLGAFDGVITFALKSQGDANGDQVVTGADFAAWADRFGDERTFADFPFVPFADGPSSADLVGPALPGLSQGDLIDKNYPGLNLATELAFASAAIRNMENTIGFKMAIDNSNIAGVSGADPYDLETEGDPENVLTGVEFAIPLAALGNPTGAVRMTAYINGGGHDFSSNQYSGVGVLTGNFGSLYPDLETEAAGEQFVTIPVASGASLSAAGVPEPGSVALLTIALTAITAAGRRRT